MPWLGYRWQPFACRIRESVWHCCVLVTSRRFYPLFPADEFTGSVWNFFPFLIFCRDKCFWDQPPIIVEIEVLWWIPIHWHVRKWIVPSAGVLIILFTMLDDLSTFSETSVPLAFFLLMIWRLWVIGDQGNVVKWSCGWSDVAKCHLLQKRHPWFLRRSLWCGGRCLRAVAFGIIGHLFTHLSRRVLPLGFRAFVPTSAGGRA